MPPNIASRRRTQRRISGGDGLPRLTSISNELSTETEHETIKDLPPSKRYRLLPTDDGFWEVSTVRKARDLLFQALRLELLGPASPEEALRESPTTRYVVGALAPFGTDLLEEERDEEVIVGEEGDAAGDEDVSLPLSQSITPSSIGLSFLVSASAPRLVVKAQWGDYSVEEGHDEKEDHSSSKEESSSDDTAPHDKPPRRRPRSRWLRSSRAPQTIILDLKPSEGIQSIKIVEGDGVVLEHVSRAIAERIAVSVFLVNRRAAPHQGASRADRWIFQPSLTVRSEDFAAVFLPRQIEPALAHSEPDRESNRLLFRARREFAIGHGCAAEWSVLEASGLATEIRTELIPSHELPKVEAGASGGLQLGMRELAEVASPTDLRILLGPLLESYGEWIEQKQTEISALSSDLQSIARSHMEDCRKALGRMTRGMESMLEDVDAFRAFRFANRAMLLQRSHTLWSRERRRNPELAPTLPLMEAHWRPFQLAFILLNLAAVIDPEDEDRAVGDLLWFPTGGGKTEAYLGLAAFTMALRRRRTIIGMRTDAGVAVLMRYTLRLLTIQQFQRAATLICACELIRREDSQLWGDYRFSLGLWIGRAGTPNLHDESRQALMRLQQDSSEEGANPCVLEACPWCGEALRPVDYWVDGEIRRTRVACPRKGCTFSKPHNDEGIPILTVDEEIYRECPSMIIATVDKFAQMPWNPEIQALFGFVSHECDRCGFLTAATQHGDGHRAAGSKRTSGVILETERLAPPDLIIQDELHLISGPLGTLVGLYETAVDFLCSRRVGKLTVGPKVVASTATVRRAFEQVQSIFQRTLRVFPPTGLEPNDSFFAVEQPVSDETPGRLYVGVCAPGKSMKTAYIRVAASLLSSGAGLRNSPTIAEPYMTLVSYFNSLRELGGARRLLDDDVPARLEQLWRAGSPRRNRPVYEELTSRVRNEAIPLLLSRLEQRHDSRRDDSGSLPLDAVLASNMISVGVDIDRLGLMTVTGQPKTTAEYIQSTSRVGRQSWGPGLVVTVYNWSRPRDLSHYERFEHYHATLYRNVEAVSATPFSSRALDRGLRGTYVSMIRLGSGTWSPEKGASEFDPTATRVAAVIAFFVRRAEMVADAATATSLLAALKGLGDEWWGYRNHPLRYGWRTTNSQTTLTDDVLLRASEGGTVGHWPAPQSLREVEDTCNVRVMGLHAE